MVLLVGRSGLSSLQLDAGPEQPEADAHEGAVVQGPICVGGITDVIELYVIELWSKGCVTRVPC